MLEPRRGAVEAVADGGQEQLLLRPEQLEQVGLRHAGAAGDRGRRGARVAALRELDRGCGDDLVAAFVGAHPVLHVP